MREDRRRGLAIVKENKKLSFVLNSVKMSLRGGAKF